MKTNELQKQINESVIRYPDFTGCTVQLEKWSEESDLSSNADVYVIFKNKKRRDFSIVSSEWMGRLASMEAWGMKGSDNQDIFTTGCPLIMVKRITGDSIIRGISQYLLMEEATAT